MSDDGSRPTRERSAAGRDPFGDLLPDRTRDEHDLGWGEGDRDDDERLLRDVPPHHR